ncbi:Hal9p [Nakaseomyces bracarensis]|uniref:Hal9p n=1 Tax=Nakaseomyces bracarensis TaxID=273131 RepID=UPI003872692E
MSNQTGDSSNMSPSGQPNQMSPPVLDTFWQRSVPDQYILNGKFTGEMNAETPYGLGTGNNSTPGNTGLGFGVGFSGVGSNIGPSNAGPNGGPNSGPNGGPNVVPNGGPAAAVSVGNSAAGGAPAAAAPGVAGFANPASMQHPSQGHRPSNGQNMNNNSNISNTMPPQGFPNDQSQNVPFDPNMNRQMAFFPNQMPNMMQKPYPINMQPNYPHPQMMIQPQKRRASKACEYCRKRKSKCDEVNPYTNKCSNCSKAGVECIFLNEPAKKKNKSTPQDKSTSPNVVGATGKGSKKGNEKSNNADNSKGGKNKGNDKSTQSTTEAISLRMAKIDRKMSVVIDNVARFEWLLDKLVQKQNEKKVEATSLTKPRRKIYTTALLTCQKLHWIKSKVCNDMSDESFTEPLNEILSNGLKWYVAQIKQYTDFSSPCLYGVEFKVHSLPPEPQAKRILENFNTYLTSVTGVFDSSECCKVTEKFYSQNGENMTFTDHLLLNVCICSGALATRLLTAGESQFLRKDRHDPTKEELKQIENNCFLNCMFYYHKISTVCSGPKTLMPLFLLTKYLQANYNTEIANTILTTAVRFTIDMSMNKKATYKSLSLNEQVRKRSMWWHFFATDKLFSLALSRPPMLLEEDMDMLTDQNYLEVIKEYILPNIMKNEDERERVSDLQEALAIIINYSEYIPFFTSYYVTKLLRIESKLFSTCFSVRNTLDNSFDGLLSKAIELFESLKNWRDNLHPSMRLESYRQYISLLYSQSAIENPALAFELACSHVLACHFRCLYLVINLSMFIVSLLKENRNLFKDSLHDIPNIYKNFSEQYIFASVKMVEIFQNINFEFHTYNDLVYPFLTGVYVILLHVVDEMDNAKNLEIPSLIELLLKAHEGIMGENFKHLDSFNMKWNISLYIYTYLLKHVIKYYNNNHPLAAQTTFNVDHFDEILETLSANTRNVKKAAVHRLISNLKDNGMYDDSENIGDGEDLKSHYHELFNDLNKYTIKILKSDDMIKGNDNWNNYSPKKMEDVSLFPNKCPSFSILYPIHSSETNHFTNASTYYNQAGETQEGNAYSNENEIKQFRDLLPLGDLLYDRDFRFIKPFQNFLSRHTINK